jgi:molybdopterin synthase catalytic subunit
MRVRIRVQPEPFDLNAEVAALAGGGASGAVASFTGHVRQEEGLTGLTLEHYPGMTEAEIGRMAEDAGKRWPLTGVTIIHRVGTLVPGEPIVLVAVASAHRAEAFAACEFLMDYLKTKAPFWKEETRGGQTGWVAAKESDDQAAERWREPPHPRKR